MRIINDFLDPAKMEKFPTHGWAENSQNIKLLRLPILRLISTTQAIRAENGIQQPFLLKQGNQVQACTSAIRNLVFTIAELSKWERISCDVIERRDDSESFSLGMNAYNYIPIYLDINLMYFRRIADHLARCIRMIAFHKLDKAPMKYSELKKILIEENFSHLVPIKDLKKLIFTFKNHSKWFSLLRDQEDGGQKKGIRDLIEHHATVLRVQHSKLENGPWEVQIFAIDPFLMDVTFYDVKALFKEIIVDFSKFCSGVCEWSELKPLQEPYIRPFKDVIIVFGRDDDIVRYWPEIT